MVGTSGVFTTVLVRISILGGGGLIGANMPLNRYNLTEETSSFFKYNDIFRPITICGSILTLRMPPSAYRVRFEGKSG
jgi:hypothetical protein